MKKFGLFAAAFLLSTGIALAQDSGKKERGIILGKQIADSLSSQAVHSYTLSLDSAQVVFGKVHQASVDAVVKIFDEKGELQGQFDGPAEGPEAFNFETRSAGKYRIEVSPFEEAQGRYSILVSTVQPVATDPAGKVDQYMIPYSGKEVPGGAVMVVKDGKVLFQKGYGMASLSYGVPFSINTPTNIGSTSKQFTAFAIQLLEDQGKLSVDDDIRKYYPELPEFDQPVTLRHLLTHTSGYREFLNLLGMSGRDLSSPLEREMLIRVVQNQPELQNVPGAEWNYNNTGFALLADLVERVTNTPFPEWMEKNVFQPLNMNNTQVRADQFQVIPGRSQGYTMSGKGEYQEVMDLGGAIGAGGIYSTLPDLVKWVENFDNPKVGSKKIIAEMTTPYVLTNGDSTGYGFGLSIGEYKGLKRISHGGADVAHRSMLMYFPEIDAIVITQSNNSSFDGSIADKTADAFLSQYFKEEEGSLAPAAEEATAFDYDPEKFDALTGRYQLEVAPEFVMSFMRDGDRIYTQATGQQEVDLMAVSDSLFQLKGIDVRITFHIKDDGTAGSLTLHQNGDHLARKIVWEPTVEDLKDFTGEFLSREIGTFYKVELKDEKLVLRTYQLPEDIELDAAGEDSFTGGFPIAEIVFERDAQGAVTGFRASNGRTRGVFFEKL